MKERASRPSKVRYGIYDFFSAFFAELSVLLSFFSSFLSVSSFFPLESPFDDEDVALPDFLA